VACREKMEKGPVDRGSGQVMAAAGGRAAVPPRDRAVTAYARTAVRRHPINGAFPVMDNNAPSAARRWCGNNDYEIRLSRFLPEKGTTADTSNAPTQLTSMKKRENRRLK
jgi:hypothetical protein